MLQRFTKFCLVGGSGVVVDMGILFLLADPQMLGLNITLSKIFAAEIAMINNFIWNEIWTFRRMADFEKIPSEKRSDGLLRRFLMFNCICGVGIGLATVLLRTFHLGFGWNVYISNLLAIGLVTFWNFGINSRFNWAWRACSAKI